MEELVINPQLVCSRKMVVRHESGIIKEVEIIGGCQGNTTGLSKLLVGYSLEEVVKRLDGIKCRGSRNGETSCPNELSKGIKEYLNK